MGLNISNRLLALMGSKLQLKSEVGIGSTFFFEANFRAEAGNAVHVLPESEKKLESDNILSKSKSIKILIAEDNAVNMQLIKIILKKKLPNAILVEAHNGLQVVEKFKEGGFSLVMMLITCFNDASDMLSRR